MTIQESSSDLFYSNLDFIASFNPSLAEQLRPLKDAVCVNHGVQGRVVVNGAVWIDDYRTVATRYLSGQLIKPDRVLTERIISGYPVRTIDQLMADLVDSEQLIVCEQLHCLQINRDIPKNIPPHYSRDALLLGSFCLLYIPHLLAADSPSQSYTLVETEPEQLAAVLHLVSLHEIVKSMRDRNIGFDLLYHPNQNDCNIRILDHYASSNPLALHGIQILRSPRLSPELIEVHSWCHAPDGLLDLVKGFLGNDTDEYNQVMHALWNTLVYPNASMLQPDIIEDGYPLVIVASGPSLDDQLEWLKAEHEQLTIISAGSALGSLLRAGIHVDIAVLLEMSSIVYQDVCDLVFEGYSLSHTVLIGSVTIDPRLPSLFSHTIFFHRPLSAAFSLTEDENKACLPQAGPQAANAALEVALQLGSRKLLLLGCDFAAVDPNKPRASQAMGSSDRSFNLPLAGNCGRTVYSSPELSTTRQLFENVIHLYGVDASSLGEGALIKGVRPLDESPIDKILQNYLSNPSRLQALLRQLPKRNYPREALHRQCLQAVEESESMQKQIALLLEQSNCWNHHVSKGLGVFVSWDDVNIDSCKSLRRRMTRFLYFFAFQVLHDSTPEQWRERVKDVLLSSQQIHQIYSTYFTALSELAWSEALPAWDHKWIRSMFQRVAKRPTSIL